MLMVLFGFIIGALVSLPVGPLGIICTQKTLSMGWKAGFLAGIGAAISDLVFSTTAVFGVSFIDDFVNSHIYLINGITGAIFLIVGLNIYLNPIEIESIKEEKNSAKLHPTLSTFLFGMSNPLTFLIFLTIFAKMGMELDAKSLTSNIIFIASILAGAIIFWFIAAKLINHSKNNFKAKTLYDINRWIGFILALFGLYSILKGIFQF